MAKPPAPAPAVPDLNEAIIELQKLMTDTADAITDTLKSVPPPANEKTLRKIKDKIVDSVDALGDVVLANVDAGLKTALGQLKPKIDEAKSTLKHIKQTQMMINIAADILAAGVGVATGGVAGAGAVFTLIDDVSAAIEESKKEDEDKEKDD